MCVPQKGRSVRKKVKKTLVLAFDTNSAASPIIALFRILAHRGRDQIHYLTKKNYNQLFVYFCLCSIQTWIGKAIFLEQGKHEESWHEDWTDGEYETQVEIYKSVLNEYQDITVEIICKVHSMNAIPELMKEGIKVNAPIESGFGPSILF